MKHFFLCVSVLFSATVLAQTELTEVMENMKMRAIGPATTSGRVTAIDAVEGPNGYILSGTASGGLWISESEGMTWKPIFDSEEVIGIGSVKIDPTNKDIIWVGTGEGNPRNSQTSGKGIYKSLDRGRTWTKKGLDQTKVLHRIVVDRQDPHTVYAAAMGSAWGPNADRGVYQTVDGGETWNKVLYVNDSVGCGDLVMDPSNPKKLFAAMWKYQRRPWYFNSGGKGSGLYMTVDGGKTWTLLTDKNGLPKGAVGRIGIAIAPSNPKVVYAMIEAETTALYRSNDGGYNWFQVNDNSVDDRPFYYHEFYVDPTNENHLIYLHSTVTESIDGGKTWKTMLPYYGVHPDHHAFWWSSTDPMYMIEGNDGGLNMSRDGGENWQFAGNLPLGQFYHINYDLETPYHVYGGMQDNGSWVGPGYVWHGGGIRDEDWQEVLFGDGFDVVPHGKNARYVYAQYQGGNLYEVDVNTGEERYAKPAHSGKEKLRFNWNAGIAIDPFNNDGVYFGSQYVHYSSDRGRSWQIISPDLTTNDTTKQKQFDSGGLTKDVTAAENYCTIISIAPGIEKGLVWVGSDDGKVHVRTRESAPFTDVTANIKGLPKGAWICQIVASEINAKAAFVVANNYRNNDWKPYLFYTEDFGKSWKSLVKEGTVNGHCLSVAQSKDSPGLIFLGTEHGLYVSLDAGLNWTQWNHDYPSVATQDLKIHPIEKDLIIGTFGRAAYVLDDIRPLEAMAKWNGKGPTQLKAIESPKGYLVSYPSPRGQRFTADTRFSGDNKSRGVYANFYFHESHFSGEDKKKKEVEVSIKKWTGETVRFMKMEPDSGLNAVYWNFETKGPYWPESGQRNEEVEFTNGPIAEPGDYWFVLNYRGEKDSVKVNFQYDPRHPNAAANYSKYKQHYDKANVFAQRAAEGIERIKEAEKIVLTYQKQAEFLNDSLKKSFSADCDTALKELKALKRLYFRPEEEKGIRDDSEFYMSKLYDAFGYIAFNSEAIAGNAETSLLMLENSTSELMDKINAYFEKDWIEWRKKAESQPILLFKDYKKL